MRARPTERHKLCVGVCGKHPAHNYLQREGRHGSHGQYTKEHNFVRASSSQKLLEPHRTGNVLLAKPRPSLTATSQEKLPTNFWPHNTGPRRSWRRNKPWCSVPVQDFSNLWVHTFNTAISSAVFDPSLWRQSSLRPSSMTVFHFSSLWSRSFKTAITSAVFAHSLPRQLSLRQSLMTLFRGSYPIGSLWQSFTISILSAVFDHSDSRQPSLRQSLWELFQNNPHMGSLRSHSFETAVNSAFFEDSLSRQPLFRQSLLTVFQTSHHFGSLCHVLSVHMVSSLHVLPRSVLLSLGGRQPPGSKRALGTSSSDMQSRGYLLRL